MVYDNWELGFESSRSGARLGQWAREENPVQNEQGKVWDERELGFEHSRSLSNSVDKKLSRCTVKKDAEIVLLDSDIITWVK